MASRYIVDKVHWGYSFRLHQHHIQTPNLNARKEKTADANTTTCRFRSKLHTIPDLEINHCSFFVTGSKC